MCLKSLISLCWTTNSFFEGILGTRVKPTGFDKNAVAKVEYQRRRLPEDKRLPIDKEDKSLLTLFGAHRVFLESFLSAQSKHLSELRSEEEHRSFVAMQANMNANLKQLLRDMANQVTLASVAEAMRGEETEGE